MNVQRDKWIGCRREKWTGYGREKQTEDSVKVRTEEQNKFLFYNSVDTYYGFEIFRGNQCNKIIWRQNYVDVFYQVFR